VATYTITAEVDEQWFEILGQITRHQEGFVWREVKSTAIPRVRKGTRLAQALYKQTGQIEEV
jgi:hypothetical protein